jgi:hypothetical protein
LQGYRSKKSEIVKLRSAKELFDSWNAEIEKGEKAAG